MKEKERSIDPTDVELPAYLIVSQYYI